MESPLGNSSLSKVLYLGPNSVKAIYASLFESRSHALACGEVTTLNDPKKLVDYFDTSTINHRPERTFSARGSRYLGCTGYQVFAYPRVDNGTGAAPDSIGLRSNCHGRSSRRLRRIIQGHGVVHRDGPSSTRLLTFRLVHCFGINVALGLVLGTVVALLAWPISWFYDEKKLITITPLLAMGIPLSSIGIQHRALLTRQMEFVALAIVEVSAQSISIITAVALAYAGDFYWPGNKYWALATMPVVVAAINSAGVWTVCRWRPGRPRLGSGVRAPVALRWLPERA